jgi:hypothetical protein
MRGGPCDCALAIHGQQPGEQQVTRVRVVIVDIRSTYVHCLKRKGEHQSSCTLWGNVLCARVYRWGGGNLVHLVIFPHCLGLSV